MPEVENPVGSWTGPVDEVRPGYRTLRWNAGAQAAKSASRSELRQVRELPLLHHRFAQSGVHAIDADDDDFLAGGLRHAATATSPICTSANTRCGEGGALQKCSATRFAWG